MIRFFLSLLVFFGSFFVFSFLNFYNLIFIVLYVILLAVISFWFYKWLSFLILLVYIGALLVLFFYLISLIPKSLLVYSKVYVFPIGVCVFLVSLNWFSININLIYDGVRQEIFFKPFINWKFSFFITFFFVFILLVLRRINKFRVGRFRLYF